VCKRVGDTIDDESVPAQEAVYVTRGEAFSPNYNVIANIAQHTTYTELFVAENEAVPSIPDPP